MAAVYVFSEALSAQAVGAMHRLGPGYKVRSFLLPATDITLINKLIDFRSE